MAEIESASSAHAGLGAPVFTTTAENRTGSTGTSWIEGGILVDVHAPTSPNRGDATNPEELLALSWATCLNAAARVVAGPEVEVVARATVALHPRLDGEGFEFSAHAHLFFEGKSAAESDALAQAAHARCPVSRMLGGRSPVTVTSVTDLT